MINPAISIDRKNKCFAVFDGFDVVRPFEDFTDEAEAEKIGRAFVAERTAKEPELIYPVIKKMTVTRSK